ncbi:TRAP transporter small permease [Poseidonibacter ostreae]|jgi:C4-dicarboxylate transporter, DctQ subunit|uniref:TRAP transporter small permease subunit n=1 Tax=Poseidonibacter ostreae TaxID=2654171 RepID=A0A6L4WUS3_9BACT|nr:TRAP transporter small permease [Poseidonibacter ostreae]KAB7886149.1 TRAP transporter small permease subunit [Poseidonibacter ostreae]KAB7887763.1 TRAP transporter small permease subunit [Poseidonibacter ostreae]KAB7888565.1 TRAP transporter small permease subunit [Poseidonibacter ostreae]MAC84148.1 C4-dicarboxylate ABC transporter permease [Arcobacter sp.]|tara:strand:+ start:462 stop:1079 length:618 start_codon:yes stop_codon:yes gene_type:complete
MIRIISKIIGYINQSIAAIGITAGVAVAFTNVVARYAFDASLVWATELTIFLFLWSAFFGAAYCFKKDAHIAVTVVLDLMPSKIAKVMLLMSHTVTITFLLAIAYYGYEYLFLLIELDERSIDLWDMPMWIVYLVIPISFFFAAFRVGEKIVQIVKTPHEEVVAESEAEQVLAGMGVGAKNKDNKHVENLNNIVKEVEKKTGGML